jgi:hypothetical protein
MEDMRRMIAAVPGVHEIKTNDAIGTMTVLYDPRRHDELKALLAATAPPPEPAKPSGPHIEDLSHLDTMLEKEAEFLSAHSHTAAALIGSVSRLDQEIKRATGNAVDLKLIGPLALAVAVFLELGVAAATPVWLTLGLFSVNHFIELHTPPSDVDPPPAPSSGDGSSVPPPTPPARPRRKIRRFP